MLTSKIKSYYEIHNCDRITQGDILRDIIIVIIDNDEKIKGLEYQYGIVLSQDCDLEQGSKIDKAEFDDKESVTRFNQFLPSILFAPAFPAELLRSGKHLVGLYQIEAMKFSSQQWKSIINNNNQRYHFLPSDPDKQVPELVIDFKSYYTIPFKKISDTRKKHYLATVNEVFRENLSHRFAHYLSRIGLPDLQCNTVT
jgi:hypothetical protein